jgi:hypothetical protein
MIRHVREYERIVHTCFKIEMNGPVELSGLMVLRVRYTVLAATSGHPDVNSTRVALLIAPLGGEPDGNGASPKKYSKES